MSLLNVFPVGESSRIDYIIREHEKLARQVRLLSQLLKEKGAITQDDFARLMEMTRSDEEPPSA